MAVVGTIKEIWRFPVKSMAGQKLQAAQVGPIGIVGDRLWATRNDTAQEIQGAKKFPELMQCSAKFREEPADDRVPHVDITFPDGSVTGSDAPGLAAKLTGLVGKPMSLWPIQPPSDLAHYRRRPMNEQEFGEEMQDIFQREPGEAFPALEQFPKEILEFTSFPGMYFDVTPIHLLTTTSLAHLAGLNPAADWDVRRFRPNFVIEAANGRQGFVETDWIGKDMRIGGVTLHCPGPTPRCGMTTRAQNGLPFDKSILRTIVKDAEQNVGLYALVAAAGTIRLGDAVEIG
ncbi:MAG: MOSC N-terminal beta barrel domain-containing protein [Betaproteobacteria bacterium]